MPGYYLMQLIFRLLLGAVKYLMFCKHRLQLHWQVSRYHVYKHFTKYTLHYFRQVITWLLCRCAGTHHVTAVTIHWYSPRDCCHYSLVLTTWLASSWYSPRDCYHDSLVPTTWLLSRFAGTHHVTSFRTSWYSPRDWLQDKLVVIRWESMVS